MTSPANGKPNARPGDKPGCLERFVRRFWVSLRWQYRRPIFFRAVVKLAARDIGVALLLIVGGLLAPVVIVLAFPVRLIVWAAQPIFAPFTKASDAAWLTVASQLNRRDPPNK